MQLAPYGASFLSTVVLIWGLLPFVGANLVLDVS